MSEISPRTRKLLVTVRAGLFMIIRAIELYLDEDDKSSQEKAKYDRMTETE